MVNELCDNCRIDPPNMHSCRANENTCIDGKDCPDYQEYCPCEVSYCNGYHNWVSATGNQIVENKGDV